MFKHVLLLSTALAATNAMAEGQPVPAMKHMAKGTTVYQGPHGAALGFTTNHKGPSHVPPPGILRGAIAQLRSREPNAPYVSSNSYFVGCISPTFCYKQAEQFVPSESKDKVRITLGLAANDTTCTTDTYTCNVRISLYTDDGGKPGTSLGSMDTTATNPWGPCCIDTTVKIKAPVTAGTPYWIVTEGTNTTDLVMWAVQDKDYVNNNFTSQDIIISGTDYGWFSYSTYDLGKDYLVK